MCTIGFIQGHWSGGTHNNIINMSITLKIIERKNMSVPKIFPTSLETVIERENCGKISHLLPSPCSTT